MAKTGQHEQPDKSASLSEQHKLGRILAIRAAMNSKNIAYLDRKYRIKQPHNFTGDYIEKMVYSNGKVNIYSKDGKEIKGFEEKPKAEEKPSKKDKASQQLPKPTDVKSS